MANTKRILVPIDEKEHCVRAFDCKYILHEQNILRDPVILDDRTYWCPICTQDAPYIVSIFLYACKSTASKMNAPLFAWINWRNNENPA